MLSDSLEENLNTCWLNEEMRDKFIYVVNLKSCNKFIYLLF